MIMKLLMILQIQKSSLKIYYPIPLKMVMITLMLMALIIVILMSPTMYLTAPPILWQVVKIVPVMQRYRCSWFSSLVLNWTLVIKIKLDKNLKIMKNYLFPPSLQLHHQWHVSDQFQRLWPRDLPGVRSQHVSRVLATWHRVCQETCRDTRGWVWRGFGGRDLVRGCKHLHPHCQEDVLVNINESCMLFQFFIHKFNFWYRGRPDNNLSNTETTNLSIYTQSSFWVEIQKFYLHQFVWIHGFVIRISA